MGCIKTLVELLSLERLRTKVSRKDSEGIAVSVDRKDADGICPVVTLVSSRIKAFVTKIADALKVSVARRDKDIKVYCSLVCSVVKTKGYLYDSLGRVLCNIDGVQLFVKSE